MRQLLQNISTGDVAVVEVPPPSADRSSLLVAARFSLISAGTERELVALGKQSLFGKARKRPDLVAKVIDNAKTEGIPATIAKVRGRLTDPNVLGYSLSGVVLKSCEGSSAAPGDLVACAGNRYACHAEIVSVPRNLCARVPDGVRPEDAAYATVASIALHGVRLADVGLGDVVAVIGLGLVGQLTLELAAAAGCVVVGFDPAADRVDSARSAGFFATTQQAELDAELRFLTDRRGADGVLVTAASTSTQPLETATALARERAVVCIVGDVPISSPRAPLFSKELRLVVSRSYGPGRYDPLYEQRGIDYPAGYVRWTEGRNLAEVLRLMAVGKLKPSRLTTHTFGLEQAADAYDLLNGVHGSLGILLRYPEAAGPERPSAVDVPRARHARRSSHERPRIGVIGAGQFARSVLIPHLRRGAEIIAIANATGSSARSVAERVQAPLGTTDVEELLRQDDLDAVVIATRHDTHAQYTIRALEAGKHVFVEKPLAINEAELSEVEQAAQASDRVLMAGFNRRYAPRAIELRDCLAARPPLVITYRVSAGRLPATHWTRDPTVGGGRIVGEMCHFVDFASFLAGAPPIAATAAAPSGASELGDDNVLAVLRLADGSAASIVYTALGDPSVAKERIEVMGERGAGVLDDFRRLTLHIGGASRTHKGKRDKGHAAEIAAFIAACRDGVRPRPMRDLAAVMRATFRIRDRIHEPLA